MNIKTENRPSSYPQWFIDELVQDKDKERARNRTLSTGETVEFLCKKHGIYKQRVCNHIRLKEGLRNRGCPECGKEQRKINFKKTRNGNRLEYPQWFIDDLISDTDKQKAKNKEITLKDYLEFNCTIHGVYTQRVADHINTKTGERKQGCPICGKGKSSITRKEQNKNKRPVYPQWFINELAHEEDREKARNKEYSWSDKVDFLCAIHGKYTQRIDAHMDTKTFLPKQGCPICGREKQVRNRKESDAGKREYPQWFIEELAHEEDKERAKKGAIVVSEELDFVCKKHGIYSQHVSNHITLSTEKPRCKCPICMRQVSCYEEEIYNYLIFLGVEVEKRNRKVIKNPETDKALELDLYIPSKRIAIEYNGSLWHGEKFKDNKKYHLNKFTICEQENIHLISIFDQDWFEKKDKVKNYLKDLVSTKNKIYGRNTIIKQITTQEANKFYSDYHLKNGCDSYIVSYGLYYKDDLLACMSFSKPKFGKQKDIEWDLSRYCVKFGYSIIGGAEKLFSSFVKEHKPNNILTYSDCDYFIGNVYSSLGFSFIEYADLPYYWAKDNIFYKRQQCQVKKLKEKYPELYNEAIEKEASNKEEYIMHKLGFYKVYRCGNKKWVWKKSDSIDI